MEKLLNVSEASSKLGLKTSTLYAMVGAKTIPFVKLGSRLLFSPKALEKWVADRTVEHGRT